MDCKVNKVRELSFKMKLEKQVFGECLRYREDPKLYERDLLAKERSEVTSLAVLCYAYARFLKRMNSHATQKITIKESLLKQPAC